MSMMRLSTLWKVDRTLDSAGHSLLAERIAERWEHEAGSLRFARSSANFVYRFRANGAERFLRFADSTERTRDVIAGEIDLLEWLGRSGAAVARPWRSKAGNLVETVETEVGVFHAVAFDRLPGTHLEVADLDQRLFRAWGAALGRLHVTLAGYAGPALAARPTWRDQLERARASIPADQPTIRRELGEIRANVAGILTHPGRKSQAGSGFSRSLPA
jgi:Ser/Thr protein kinase RdoA (MazF antagonist)